MPAPSRLLPPTHLHALAWVAAALLLAALLAAGGCQKSQRRADDEESLARSIAVVNNEKIAYEDFLNEYQLFLTQWDRFIQNDPEKKQKIKELLLERIVDARLIDQEARRKGIEVNDAELNRRTLELFSSPEEGEANTAEMVMAREGYGEWSRGLRRRLVHRKVIRQEVIEKIRITPAEMRAYYDKHRKSFYRPERVKVRHIAVGSRSLYNRVSGLLARDHDFVELVRQYSITPDRYSDGELGYVERGMLPEEFDEAIFNMKRVGSVTPRNDPVQTQMGYHIFRLEGREPEGQLSFREALPRIRGRLLRDKQAEAYARWVENLRAKATIVIDDELLHAE